MMFAAIAAGLAGWAMLRATQAFCAERRAFHPDRGAVLPPSPPIEGLRTVEPAAGLRGFWIPSRNGAAVVLLHGSNGDRAQLVPEARLLAAAGFGALLYDSPGHGESAGSARWDEPERQALRAAVSFAAAQPGVERVGGLGFSMGASILAQTAPDEPRLAAVVLESCFADSAAHTRWEYRRLGPLQQWPARWAQRWEGFAPARQPVAEVPRIAPRPLLIISGLEDENVPPAMAGELFAAARTPRELWLVPGAGHGGFAQAAPDYAVRLVEFFRETLSAR